jgi:hypothetical protein
MPTQSSSLSDQKPMTHVTDTKYSPSWILSQLNYNILAFFSIDVIKKKKGTTMAKDLKLVIGCELTTVK